MNRMKQPSDFWDKHAAHYDRFLHRDMAAYQQMYELICPAVRHKTVLELATGTGLIASHIINASEEMIHLAKEANRSSKLHFSVQDMFHLPYADHSFDVAIVSNALHIVPQPEKALAEACRVLKDDGLLIAPTFTHGDNTLWGQVQSFFMRLSGFPLRSRWTCEEYLAFLRQCGWRVRTSRVLPASFPLTYAECIKSEI